MRFVFAILLLLGCGRHPAKLRPLGTNQPAVGMHLLNPRRQPLGIVKDVDRHFEFEDGTIRPGVLLRSPNGFNGWVPVDSLDKALVAE